MPERKQTKGRSRIVIFDCHRAVGEMMTPIIEGIAGCQVVGHASDAAQALELCRRTQPDLLVLDVGSQGTPGLEVLGAVRQACPTIRVLVYSANISLSVLRQVLAAGVHGVVEKMAALAELRAAIEALQNGQVFFCSCVSTQLKELVRRTSLKRESLLTPREKTVLRLLAEGSSVREIATTLGITASTVATHRHNLMRKTELRSPAQLSLYAAQMGLVGESRATLPPPETGQ